MSLTDEQKFRIEVAARILSAKLDDFILMANREQVSEVNLQRIDGAIKIADALIKAGSK